MYTKHICLDEEERSRREKLEQDLENVSNRISIICESSGSSACSTPTPSGLISDRGLKTAVDSLEQTFQQRDAEVERLRTENKGLVRVISKLRMHASNK